jgi:DNA replication protein DnaC
LQTLKFVGDRANALFIGKPGTGKSHVAKAVAYHGVQQGLKVAYAVTAGAGRPPGSAHSPVSRPR